MHTQKHVHANLSRIINVQAEEARRKREEVEEAAKRKAAADARAKEVAALREIFQSVDRDGSGYIDDVELVDLGRAVDPEFASEKCRVLLHKMANPFATPVAMPAASAMTSTVPRANPFAASVPTPAALRVCCTHAACGRAGVRAGVRAACNV